MTRNEIDYPLDFDPVKVVPYAMGEFGHWGADLEGNDIQRLWGQVGVRASVPFWAVDPTIRDSLFNLNGLAHKVVFDAEASYADADQSFTEFPLYDNIDDTSVDEFRRRLFFAPVGSPALAGQFDPKFDPRYWAIRSGIQDDVTRDFDGAGRRSGGRASRHAASAADEARRDGRAADRRLDDVRFEREPVPRSGPRQLWARRRADRLRLAVVHRRSVLDPLRRGSGHVWRRLPHGVARRLINRPLIGNAYLGFRAMDGPFQANLVIGSVNYRMSQKWIGSATGSIDLGNSGNIGQSFYVSRIGESLIATVGANYDQSKDNVGFSFLVEPRFLPKLNVTRRTGIEIPPPGAYGLE